MQNYFNSSLREPLGSWQSPLFVFREFSEISEFNEFIDWRIAKLPKFSNLTKS